MRSDFGKVVIERPRIGHGNPNIPTRESLCREDISLAYEEEYEDGGTRRKMHRRGGRHVRECKKIQGKSFNDLIGPLMAYLHKNVGKPVNNLRSELTAVLGNKPEPQRHVLTTHFEDYVSNRQRAWPNIFQYGFYQDEHGLLRWKPRQDPDWVYQYNRELKRWEKYPRQKVSRDAKIKAAVKQAKERKQKRREFRAKLRAATHKVCDKCECINRLELEKELRRHRLTQDTGLSSQ